MTREKIAGPDSGPEPPFPIHVSGRIIRGFGRGSKELGIPTANIPITGLDVGGHTDIQSGVYFGFATIDLSTVTDESEAPLPPGHPSSGANVGSTNQSQRERHIKCYPAVLSIGYNLYYNNSVRSVEIHLLEKFDKDFYNALLNLSILGFIRPEANYDSLQALVDDINTDIDVARDSLDRPSYRSLTNDPYLLDFTWDTNSN